MQWSPLRVMVGWQKTLWLVALLIGTVLVSRATRDVLPLLVAAIVVNVLSGVGIVVLARLPSLT